MIKKVTAYSFILLANLVLLMHAVLPHHHHDQLVCIEHHCMGDEEAHDHGTTTHDYQHGCDSSSNTCVLKQAVIVPSSQARFVNNCNNCTDNHNHNFFILSNFGYEDLEPFSAVVISIPEISSFFISFVTPTLGLRAPPIA